MSKAVDYVKETKSELKHVSWPTRRQAIVFTVVVILISFGVAFFLGFFDYLFQLGLEQTQIGRSFLLQSRQRLLDAGVIVGQFGETDVFPAN